jgi:hypothetical protein
MRVPRKSIGFGSNGVNAIVRPQSPSNGSNSSLKFSVTRVHSDFSSFLILTPLPLLVVDAVTNVALDDDDDDDGGGDDIDEILTATEVVIFDDGNEDDDDEDTVDEDEVTVAFVDVLDGDDDDEKNGTVPYCLKCASDFFW